MLIGKYFLTIHVLIILINNKVTANQTKIERLMIKYNNS